MTSVQRDAENQGATRGSVSVHLPEDTKKTTTSAPDQPTIGELAKRAGVLRTRVNYTQSDVDDIHRKAQEYDLDDRAASKGRQGVPGLLRELSRTRGLGWSDIARLVGVSVSAVRKWRLDGAASADNRFALAKLAAFLDLLEECAIEDPAQWMEMRLPLPEGYDTTPIDVYRAGAFGGLLDYAGQRVVATELLDKVTPSWRDQRSAHEVYTESDGKPAIRLRKDN